MGEAFKPLGVYVNFWQPTLPAGGERSYRVTIINDTYEPARGRLELGWQSRKRRVLRPPATNGPGHRVPFRRWEK